MEANLSLKTKLKWYWFAFLFLADSLEKLFDLEILCGAKEKWLLFNQFKFLIQMGILIKNIGINEFPLSSKFIHNCAISMRDKQK